MAIPGVAGILGVVVSITISLFILSAVSRPYNDKISLAGNQSFVSEPILTTPAPVLLEQPLPVSISLPRSNSTCSELVKYIMDLQYFWRLNPDTATKPLINYGYYSGQGFGRLFDHFVSTAIISAGLGRPILLDTRDRDPYNNFLAYINVGDYDWVPPQSLTPLLAKLSSFLPKPEVGFVDFTLDDVLPLRMHGSNNESNYNDFYGGNPVNRLKYLYSPNWGTGWFTHAQAFLTGKLLEGSQCPKKTLISHLIDTMFSFTHLTENLFAKRKVAVLGETPDIKFGSVHLRTHFIKESEDTFVEKLSECMLTFPNITHWWILSDSPPLAKNLTSRIEYLYDGYTDDFLDNNAHSFSTVLVKEPFHQDLMMGSVLDFAILWKSDVALTTSGSFGSAGAAGRKKSPTGSCWKFVVNTL